MPYGVATGVPPTTLNLLPTTYPLPPVKLVVLEVTGVCVITLPDDVVVVVVFTGPVMFWLLTLYPACSVPDYEDVVVTPSASLSLLNAAVVTAS